MKWIILTAAIVFNALANILIKAGVRGGQDSLLTTLKAKWLSPFIMGGILSFALALAAYSYVLSKMNLSVAYPIMTGAGFMLIAIASCLFFKEMITLLQIMGFILIMLGIWLLVR